jgi:putative drug exporter of the RND superfamily
MSRWAIAHPKRTLAVWGAIAGILALIGMGVADRLHDTNIIIPDTKAGKAEELAKQRFGESSGLLILLKGSPAALDRQGPKLAHSFDRWKDLTVTSAWTPGLGKALRPERSQALVLVRIQKPFEESSDKAVPRIRDRLNEQIHAPVTAHMTGFADIAHAIHSETVSAIEKAELIAAPLLIIILLLVFRSPVAAGVPLALGLTTVGAAGGVLDLINRIAVLDVVSFNLASMMGLALGVDYSLLLVSRFREELATGQDVRFAAQTATARAGHTVRFAGLALGVAMLAALFVSPGTIMFSSVIGVLVAAVLSVITAITALPAVLMLLGERINAWRFGAGSGESAGIAAAALSTLRRPALAAGLVLVAVVALAAPAMAIETGPPDPRMLPDSSAEKQDFEAIRHTLGDGWGAPYEVIVASPRGAITTSQHLKQIQHFQDELSQDKDVLAVFGPGMIAKQTAGLGDASAQLARGGKQLSKSEKALGRLNRGLSKAATGTLQLQAGLDTAATGASKLAAGGDDAAEGALQIQAGLATSQQGASLLSAGLSRSSPGLQKLAQGAGKARSGAGKLRSGVLRIRRATANGLPKIKSLRRQLLDATGNFDKLQEPVTRATQELDKALAALNAMGFAARNDPHYFETVQAVDAARAAVTGNDSLTGQQVDPNYEGLAAALSDASAGTKKAADAVGQIERRTTKLLGATKRLTDGSIALRQALNRISDGASRLSQGGSKAIEGAGDLSSGLARLDAGAGSLASGVGNLQSGARRLADGLSSGDSRSDQLVSGLNRLQRGVVTFQARTEQSQEQLSQSGRLGKILGSGYTTLAAIDTADSTSRAAASQTVNLDKGGTAARVLVVEHGASNRPGSPLRPKLEHDAAALSKQTGAAVLVGGPAPALQDFDSAVADSFPWLILVLCLVTYLVLVPLLRSVLLPLLAVALNVLTVGAALGVLTLCFQGSAPLGGPGYIDDIMRTSIFALVFALSIDYEVFLLARMREGYLHTGNSDAAIEYGLRRTAGVITGAALIMTGVFVAFALAPIISMRELGVGLTIAVLLDTTVIRLVLLPAAMKLTGDRIWWMPAWMHRLFGEEQRTPGLEPEMARVRRLAG